MIVSKYSRHLLEFTSELGDRIKVYCDGDGVQISREGGTPLDSELVGILIHWLQNRACEMRREKGEL